VDEIAGRAEVERGEDELTRMEDEPTVAREVERVEPADSAMVKRSVPDGGAGRTSPTAWHGGRARGEQAASDAEDEREEEEESASSREDECWEKEEKGGVGAHAGSAGESVRFFSTLALSLFRFQGSGIRRRQEKARRLDCVTGLSTIPKSWRR
jgi:hypothetical protein